MNIRDILDSAESYQKYLSGLSLVDLEGIDRRIDGVRYPERQKLVFQQIQWRKSTASRLTDRPNGSLLSRIWKKLF